MSELLRANMVADFAFYRRSRLLLSFALVFLLLTGLVSLPAVFLNSKVRTFYSLQQIFSILSVFLLFLAGGLGLFIISSHLRSRSLKMVFTKPCTPAVWLFSAFASAIVVSFLLNAIVFASATILSLFWHVPVRPALLFLSVESFLASIGIIAYLMLLATVFHPAVAATVALIFNADLFYGVQVWTRAAIKAGHTNFALRILDRLFHYFYLLLPMVHAFGRKADAVYANFRVPQGDWKYLLYSLGYTVTLSAFCYFLALFALQRRRHI